MQVRALGELTGFDSEPFFSTHGVGYAAKADLATVPDEYLSIATFIVNVCPVCRNAPHESGRIMLYLMVDFTNIKNLGVFVWAHKLCFGDLPISDRPAPIPW